MKKTLLFIASAAMLMTSCAKEQLVEPVFTPETGKTVTIVGASFENYASDTKVTFNAGGGFLWQANDDFTFELANNTASGTIVDNSINGNQCQIQFSGDRPEADTYEAGIFAVCPGDLGPVKTEGGLKVTVPASREWSGDDSGAKSYAALLAYSIPTEDGQGGKKWSDYSFSHLGGLVRITIDGVPETADKFVFTTPNRMINGEFTVVEGEIKTNTENLTTEQQNRNSYTLTFTAGTATKMVFYVPLPCGTYPDGFSFSLYAGETQVYTRTSSTSKTIERAHLLPMPTINIVGGGGESGTQTVQNVPADHKGDFYLAQTENVLVKIPAEDSEHNINFKYNGTNPETLEIQVVDGEGNPVAYAGTVSGNLPNTHVEFTKGTIANVTMTTSATTLEVVYPARISSKLTVTGGNVLLKGAKVQAIEIDENATADGESPVTITLEKTQEGNVPEVVTPIEANADVNIAPEEGVEVFVEKGNDSVEVTQTNEDADSKGEVVTVNGNEAVMIGNTSYETLALAIDVVTEGQTIKVLKNIDDAKGITVDGGKNFTVDFGGKTYTCASDPAGSNGTKNQVFQLLQNSTITFKNGTINVAEAAKENFRFIIQNYANLTLEDMVLDGSNLSFVRQDGKPRYTVSNNQGPVKFTGKTDIIAATENGVAFDVCKYATYTEPEVTWDSEGSVTGTIELTGGEFLVAKDLTVNAPILCSAESELTFNAGKTLQGQNFSTTKNSKGYTENNTGVVIVKNGGDLTIKGAGTIKSNAVSAAIVMTEKGDDATNAAKLTVNDATLIGKNFGISGNGTRHNTVITINSGTIKGTETNDCAGIYHPQRGTLAINGGTIEGAVGIYVKAGSVETSVEAGTIKGVGAQSGYQPLTGGFHSTGDAIVFDNCDYPGGAPNATINGGTFISTNGLAVASYAKEGVEGGPIKPVINGGTFSDMSGVNYVVDSKTYKLANDVNLGENILEINSGKAFSIDLNGKTLTGRTNIKHGNVTFKNGNIAGGNKQALNVYGSSTEATNYSVVTVDSDVTVTADVYAVCVFGATAGGTGYGAVANIAGTITTTGDEKNGAVFVSGNLGVGNDSEWAVSSKNAVNIQSTAKITSSTDAALALNGSATVTVASGAELTGATAIAAKRGKLIVNGGTITGTMNPGNGKPDAYFNGTEMTGSAVSATATYKNDGPLYVELEGGEYTSQAYTILNNHDGCEFQISGGSYTTNMGNNGIAVYARLGSVNITGGTFENESNGEATLHVGCPTANLTNGPKLTISGDGTVVKNTAEGSYTHNTSWSPLTVNMANELTYKAVDISGGTFHGQKPEKDDHVIGDNGYFLATDYKVTETTEGSNVWTVSANQQN